MNEDDALTTEIGTVIEATVPGSSESADTAQALPRRFLFNINVVFLATLISNTIGFLVAILLARALGPEGRGEVALYHAAVSLGYAFMNLGIGSAAFYFVTRHEVSGRRAAEAALTISILAATVSALCVVITALAFSGRLEGKDIPYGLAILAVPALIQLRVTDGLLRAEGRFGAVNALELALPVSMLLFLGATEVVVGLTVSRAVWTWTLSFIPPLVLGYALLGPRFWPHSLAPLSMLKRVVRFGGQIQLTTLLQLFNYRVDTFLILILVNTAGVGLYSVASSQTEGLLIIANSVAVVFLTNVTSGDADNALRMTPVTCRNTLLVTGAAAAVAAVIAPFWVPAVFGSDYQGAVVPYLWLLPGMVALSGAKILAAYVFSRGRPIINAWISLVILVIDIPMTSALIALFGVSGAAVGTSAGYILTLALTSIAYKRLSGGSILEALLPRRSDVGIYVDGVRSLLRRLPRLHRSAVGVDA
jgi:O-antigen/teichoic acid export membrane protein